MIPKKEIRTIEVNKIVRPQTIDRMTIDPQKITELAKNIAEQGLLQAPVVRPWGEVFEVVAGDRRILALKQLGWKYVECSVCELDDKETAEIRATENLQREDLTKIEEARIYRNLKDNFGMSYDDIARKVGKSAGTVQRRLDLLKMPPNIQKALQEKKISAGVAEALWPIADPAALDYYLGFAIEHGVTCVIANQWAKDWKTSQKNKVKQMVQEETTHSPMAPRPTYIACDLCQEPELVQNLVTIRLCKACAKQLARAQIGTR